MIPKKKRQRHKDGDVFVVPLNDGTYSLGQILAYEREALNSVACAFYNIRIVDGPTLEIPAPLPQDRVISILLTTRDLLNRAVWPVIADRAIPTMVAVRPYEQYRVKKWVGARIIGSGIVDKFLNAYFGLAPWDAMQDPNYFDSLLLHASLKPSGLVFAHAA
jgi:immunity protein 26 of polymorphic toxin system